MTWVAWRQQRPATVAAIALLAVAGPVLLGIGWQMTSFAHDSGLAACAARAGDCQLLAEAFVDRYRPVLEPVSLFGALLPVVLGLLFGGPLLAREFEQGTHQLAWTQSVTRSRWLGARLAMAAGVLVAVSAVAALLLTWWYGRFDQLHISSRGAFERGGLVPVATAVLAFAIATAAGAFARRVVPALATGLVALFVVGIPLNLAAQHWLPPRPLAITHPAGTPSPRAGLDDQMLSSGYRDRTGRALPAQALGRLCPGTAGRQAVSRCLAANGVQRIDRYQPASRAWQLGLAQSALYLAVAALFLVLAWWRTLRPD
jgi:ABC-2 family transporter protein